MPRCTTNNKTHLKLARTRTICELPVAANGGFEIQDVADHRRH